MLFKFVALLAFVTIQSESVTAQFKSCPSSRLVQADQCAVNLFLVGNSVKTGFPQNMLDMAHYCSSLAYSGLCVGNFSNDCLIGLPSTVTKLLVRGAAHEIERQCSEPKHRQEFLDHVTCLGHDLPALDSCMASYIDRLYGVSSVRREDKIPITCCTFYHFKSCINAAIVKNGGKICSPEDRKYVDMMISSFAAEMLPLLCNHTPPNSVLCDILIAPPANPSIVKSKSILPPFISAFDGFRRSN